jgi:hypothetical protein
MQSRKKYLNWENHVIISSRQVFAMNLKKEIKENQIIVVAFSKPKYNPGLIDIMGAAQGLSKRICFVSLNKPYSTLAKTFEDKELDANNIVFIDCVSGGIAAKKGSNVSFVSSPKALTELSLAISDVLGANIDMIIFDSLSTLLAYEDSATAIKFVHSVVSKTRMTKKKFVFTSLKDDNGSDLMKDVTMFVDKVVNVGK